jgi:hypothetical protein
MLQYKIETLCSVTSTFRIITWKQVVHVARMGFVSVESNWWLGGGRLLATQ